MAGAIEAMREAFGQLSAGRARVPQRLSLRSPGGDTLFMPGYLEGSRALGGKVVSVFPENPGRGLPTVTGLVLLLDEETGRPVLLLDGARLTVLRTGAATGLATDLLARPDASVLALFGAGAQARGQLAGVRAVRDLEEVRVVSRTGASARALAREISGVPTRVVDEPRRAVEGADLVVTATDSAAPVFPAEAIAPGTHVNAIGSYRPDTREIEAGLVARATVVVDTREAALEEAGDLLLAIEEDAFSPGSIHAELGEIVNGERPGRTSDREVTLFKSVGSAAQDLALAARVRQAAEARGLGTRLEL